jgi:hypothetical protein
LRRQFPHIRPDGGLRAGRGRGTEGQGTIKTEFADGQEPGHF